MEAPAIRPWPAVHYSYPISFSYPLQHLLNIWFHPTLVFFIHVVLYNYNTKREFPMPAVASIPYQPINVDYLEGEVSGHGVTFKGEGFGDSCVAKMGLENGSTPTLMLPSGLITSYKTPMWHGGTVELLHTSISKGENGGAVIQAGVSLAFDCCSDGQVSWSPRNWTLLGIKGVAEESIQVDLISRDLENMLEVHCDSPRRYLKLRLLVSNSKSSLLQLRGSSTPDATYAISLEGSNFFNRPPFLTNFGIIPPDFGQKNESGFGQLWGQMALKGPLSGWGTRNPNAA